nr:immunoglobulin heavy chain junction region [Mus musculus]
CVRSLLRGLGGPMDYW